jgi:SAM-dependent methyltransferase/uncharacterized protein YbaR (Trm112 family)
MDPWLLEHLVCPRTGTPLELRGDSLCASSGTQYPIVEGVPVLLRDDVPQTIGVAHASLSAAHLADHNQIPDDFYISTLGISDEEKKVAERLRTENASVVDPVVAVLVAATNGNLYRNLIGRLPRPPLPELRLPDGGGRRFLDVGCGWGRWLMAAARKGYQVVGIDPSLGAVLAARRLCAQLGCEAQFVVGDARFLPFATGTFDVVFSYSVIQHFSRVDALQALGEIARVLRLGGESFIQMANALGIRSLYHLARRGFRDGQEFEVRYWRPTELTKAFETAIGPSELTVDCYFGLGLQASDAYLLTPAQRTLLALSEWLRRQANWCPPLRQVADSLYVNSLRQKHSERSVQQESQTQ